MKIHLQNTIFKGHLSSTTSRESSPETEVDDDEDEDDEDVFAEAENIVDCDFWFERCC